MVERVGVALKGCVLPPELLFLILGFPDFPGMRTQRPQ